jgi:hypothetical protein
MIHETSRLNEAVEMVAEPVVESGGPCVHIMALHIDPAGGDVGVIRCVSSRSGEVSVPGFVDRSRIHRVEMGSRYRAEIGTELDIGGAMEVVEGLPEYRTRDFLGFEDPIVRHHAETGLRHLYCTIPFLDHESGATRLYLGHAEGPDLSTLRMTDPVLGPVGGVHGGAKEVTVAPRSRAGHRKNLVESNDTVGDTTYSVLRTAIATEPGQCWEYGDLVLHPRDGAEWCAGHVSPGPLLPRSFADVGEDRRLGLLNGREANERVGGRVRYGSFSVGLMAYDYERGEVVWVSERPVIRDPAARSITFASAFGEVEPGRGVVYAHVDDSYVRAYLVDADALLSMYPDSPSG